MKKLIVALLFLTGIAVYSQVTPVKSTVERAQSMTVLITNNSTTGMGMGTGVLLDATHVLTCFHMERSYKDDFMVFTYPLGQVVKAKVEGGNQAEDILILTLSTAVTVSETPVFTETYAIGEPITVVGNALGGMQWFVTHGIISGEEQGYLETDALVNPGNSGGPWFNDKGEIVAITDWRLGPGEHVPGLAGGVSAKKINLMLKARQAQSEMQGIMLQILGNANIHEGTK